MNEYSVSVIVADDHPSSVLGMSQGLEGSSTIKLMGTVTNSTDLVTTLNERPCDVLVLDYVMPGGKYGDGLSLLSFLQRRYPTLRIVTITMIDNPVVLRAIRKQGIDCILSKSDAISHLVGAVHAAFVGASYLSPYIKELLHEGRESAPIERSLSPREIEVVRLFCGGYTVGEIATQLSRSKQTISSQKASAMKKLGITRAADLIRYTDEGKLTHSPAPDESAADDTREGDA